MVKFGSFYALCAFLRPALGAVTPSFLSDFKKETIMMHKKLQFSLSIFWHQAWWSGTLKTPKKVDPLGGPNSNQLLTRNHNFQNISADTPLIWFPPYMGISELCIFYISSLLYLYGIMCLTFGENLYLIRISCNYSEQNISF